MKGVDAMRRIERTSTAVASMAARYIKHPDKRIRSISASALSNRRWGKP